MFGADLGGGPPSPAQDISRVAGVCLQRAAVAAWREVVGQEEAAGVCLLSLLGPSAP